MRRETTRAKTRNPDLRRRGMTLLEVTIAAGLLAMVVTSSIQMLRVLAAHERATERRLLAIQVVQAVAEQVGNTPWGELTPQAATQIAIPEAAVRHLPGAKLAVAVNDETAPVAARRVAIQLTWNASDGRPARPVRLTAWTFPPSLSNGHSPEPAPRDE